MLEKGHAANKVWKPRQLGSESGWQRDASFEHGSTQFCVVAQFCLFHQKGFAVILTLGSFVCVLCRCNKRDKR